MGQEWDVAWGNKLGIGDWEIGVTMGKDEREERAKV